MSDSSNGPDLVNFQLAVLDAYQKLLESCSWDEAKLNDALKTAMASVLPLLRAQHTLGEQLFASHKELVRKYRQALEASLGQAKEPD